MGREVEWTYECHGKGKDINNAQRESGFKHSTRPIDAVVEVAAAGGDAGVDVAAIGTGDAAHDDDAADEGADEEEVDEGDEEGVVAGGGVGDDGRDDPAEREAGDDEEDEDVVGGELVGAVVLVDEPALEGLWLVG